MPWGMLLSNGGPWALLSLAVAAVITGWLVPARTVRMLTQRGDDYRSAWERSDEARRVQAEQLSALLEYARTADAVLRSLPAPRVSS